jgi:hypothetical protein
VTGHSWEWLIATIEELTGDDSLDALTDRRMEADNAREQAEKRGQGTRSDLLPTISRK